MIAKIVVWGEDRAAAVGRLRRALAATAVLGPATNLGFLARVAAHPAFAEGAIDTGFIERHRAALLARPSEVPAAAIAAAALHRLAARASAARAAQTAADRFSPWAENSGWRLGEPAAQELVLSAAGRSYRLAARRCGPGWQLEGVRGMFAAALTLADDGACRVTIDGVGRSLVVLDEGDALAVSLDGETWVMHEIDALAPPAGEELGGGKLTAPMPGKVTSVLVSRGSRVARGDPLIVVEAMKMEHTIRAPVAGIVAAIRYAAGDLVEEGAELVALEPAAPAEPG